MYFEVYEIRKSDYESTDSVCRNELEQTKHGEQWKIKYQQSRIITGTYVCVAWWQPCSEIKYKYNEAREMQLFKK